MASRSGGAPIRTNKVRSGMDQAFTLPKGTSAAPIKGPGMGKFPATRGLTKADIARLKKLNLKPHFSFLKEKTSKGTSGGKRLTQAEKAKKSAAAFVKLRQQIAKLGKKPKVTRASDFIKRRNKIAGVPGGKAMVIGSGLAAGAALTARGKIKKLRKSIPKYGKNLTAKEKADLLIKHSRKTKRPGTPNKKMGRNPRKGVR